MNIVFELLYPFDTLSIELMFLISTLLQKEEEEFNSEPWRVEESKKGSVRGGSEEQLNEMKLSVCRNIGNRANRSGKRKISWQDQVALRV